MNQEIMTFQILKVKDAGDLDKERVILKATKDTEISWYILFDNTYNDDGSLSNLWRHMFIFPRITVKAGDFVWLYTKKGEKSNRGNDSNTTTHLLYWGMDETIWNHDGDMAYLVKYIDSQSVNV